MEQEAVFELLRAERQRQCEKWGDQSGHTRDRWYAVLTEEFLEAYLELTRTVVDNNTARRVMEELVHVAAVAVQWLETMSPPPVEEEAPHAFEGVLLGTPDRDCTRCGRPDRDPIHAVAQKEALRG